MLQRIKSMALQPPPWLRSDATAAHMAVEMKKNLAGIRSWEIVVRSGISAALINLVISFKSGQPLWRLMAALIKESEIYTHGFSVGDTYGNMQLFQVHHWRESCGLDHCVQHVDQCLFTRKIPSCWLLILLIWSTSHGSVHCNFTFNGWVVGL